ASNYGPPVPDGLNPQIPQARDYWETNDEESEFSSGGLHRDLARLLRLRPVRRATHGESEGRYPPPETGRKVGHVRKELRGLNDGKEKNQRRAVPARRSGFPGRSGTLSLQPVLRSRHH